MKPIAIPLMEYDSSPDSVIMPGHEKINVRFPEKAVFAFVGDCIDEYAQAHGLKEIAAFECITKRYPIYLGSANGTEFVLCQAPLGAPAAVQILDWLIAYGVRTVLSTGSCGTLVNLPENVFLIPARALRDEGTSFHYLEPSRYVETNRDLRQNIERYFQERGLPYRECTTWTTDGFFRETARKVSERLQEGCSCVEMECAALAACAQFRNARFAEILFTADSLANTLQHDERNWGADSLMPALLLCVDVITSLSE